MSDTKDHRPTALSVPLKKRVSGMHVSRESLEAEYQVELTEDSLFTNMQLPTGIVGYGGSIELAFHDALLKLEKWFDENQ